MKRTKIVGAIAALVLVLSAMPALAQVEPDSGPFWNTWARTDKPVADGQVERTWMWGPKNNTPIMTEPYFEASYEGQSGERAVQYFDKARMEVNKPEADPNAVWYVTNGLLVVEMATGMIQVGNDSFIESEPAEVNIAGDPGHEDTPTYATYGMVMDEDPYAEGAVIDQAIARDGTISTVGDAASYGVTAEVLVPETNHRVASVFWDFMNSEGLVWTPDGTMTEELFLNPYYATGLPITEAYWAYIDVAGTEMWVLTQAFERRVLTYTPEGEQEGWRVEAGNVGLHYYEWRYAGPDYPQGPFYAEIGELNGSGVSGTASFELDGDTLSVSVEASGLTPDEQHAMHIHGTEEGQSICPVLDLDTDGDGLISLEEGVPAYGGVVVDLQPYPVADAEGNISFEETYTIDPEVVGDLSTRTIIIHGLEVDGEYDASLPVGCGVIEEGELPPQAEQYASNIYQLNNSGVDGYAFFSLEGDQLTVEVQATGLTPDEQHMMHIHGFEDGSVATCPTQDLDTDGDGEISLEEGVPAYGGVVLPLEPYPTADADGNIDFEQTYTVDLDALGDLATRTIVIHGLLTPEGYDAALPVGCGVITEGAEPAAETYHTEIGELNNSGVSGLAVFSLDGDQLHVMVQASGLSPDEEHMMHIHGVDGADSICPTEDLDTDGDGEISLEEGVPAYGGVILPLEPYPTADADGMISFDQTYTVDPLEIGDLATRTIVIHGMLTPEGYDAALPVGCGEILYGPIQAEYFAATFTELNGVGIDGHANLILNGDQLTVKVEASGLTPDETHAIHIHGVEDGVSVCPLLEADTDGDGIISLEEGVPAYGGVILDLPPYPVADAEGNISFEETYTVNLDELGDLTTRTIIVHGTEVDGAYDGSVPVGCAPIEQLLGGAEHEHMASYQSVSTVTTTESEGCGKGMAGHQH
jgi:hypothetical protein